MLALPPAAAATAARELPHRGHRPRASLGSRLELRATPTAVVPARLARSVSPPAPAGASTEQAAVVADESDQEDMFDFWSRDERRRTASAESAGPGHREAEDEDAEDESDSDAVDEADEDDDDDDDEEIVPVRPPVGPHVMTGTGAADDSTTRRLKDVLVFCAMELHGGVSLLVWRSCRDCTDTRTGFRHRTGHGRRTVLGSTAGCHGMAKALQALTYPRDSIIH